jgi:hypothetical protein
MQDQCKQSRRQLFKLGAAALALIPVVAFGAKNAGLRASMKYKDTPEGDKQCDNCAQWIPGPTPKDLGGCKIFAGDTEVAPKGYCVAWAKRP